MGTQLKTISKRLLGRMLSVGNLDLWSAKYRLYDQSVRHAEVSGVMSADDCPGAPTDRLLDLAESVIHLARQVDLRTLDSRAVPELVHLWPGEHYRLLVAILTHLHAKTVVEIGTFTGLSALAMLTALPGDGRLVTFDVVPWTEIKGAFLNSTDFADGRLCQVVADPGDAEVFNRHALSFQAADVVFVDGPKDGCFEARLLEHVRRIGLRTGALLIFDDIRNWNMLRIWRGIRQPKLDITSFGHWCGTGIVEWE